MARPSNGMNIASLRFLRTRRVPTVSLEGCAGAVLFVAARGGAGRRAADPAPARTALRKLKTRRPRLDPAHSRPSLGRGWE